MGDWKKKFGSDFGLDPATLRVIDTLNQQTDMIERFGLLRSSEKHLGQIPGYRWYQKAREAALLPRAPHLPHELLRPRVELVEQHEPEAQSGLEQWDSERAAAEAKPQTLRSRKKAIEQRNTRWLAYEQIEKARSAFGARARACRRIAQEEGVNVEAVRKALQKAEADLKEHYREGRIQPLKGKKNTASDPFNMTGAGNKSRR